MQRLITRPTAALRLARTIASDILVYNRDLVSSGVRGDNLFEVLSEHIQEGRRHFADRVSPDVANSHDFIDRALVDVLLYRAMTDAQKQG